jgi:hypothetical protein
MCLERVPVITAYNIQMTLRVGMQQYNYIRDPRFVGIIFLIIYLLPITLYPLVLHGTGIFDWDTSLQRNTALYLSYLKFGQIPGNNPWIGGGVPLSPTVPVYGLNALYTMLFGPAPGLLASVATYFALGYWGALKLIGYWTKDRYLQTFFALYFVFGNALAWHLAVGHTVFLPILLLPSLLYYTINYQQYLSGFKVGFIFGISVLDSIIYVNQYIALTLAIAALYLLIKHNRNKASGLAFCLQVILTFLSVTFYRLFTIIPTFGDYPRLTQSVTSYEFTDFLRFLIMPFANIERFVTTGMCSGVWENANYIGVTAFIIIGYVGVIYRRVYLVPFLLLALIYSNDNSFWDFNYYLKHIPTFSSHGCTARLRLFTPLLFGFTLVSIFIDQKLHVRAPWIIYSKLPILGLTLIEIFMVSSIALFQSHTYRQPQGANQLVEAPGWGAEFVNYTNLPPKLNSIGQATAANIGVLRSQDSYLPAERVSVGKDSEGYVAEFTHQGKPISPLIWSPNLIVFQNVSAGDCVHTNIPIGSYWRVNGVDLYKNEKIIDFKKLICANADSDGIVRLEWKTRGAPMAILVNILIAIITALYLIVFRRKSDNSWGSSQSRTEMSIKGRE